MKEKEDCPRCNGSGLVCENHQDKEWGDMPSGCECGAGMPCECHIVQEHEMPNFATDGQWTARTRHGMIWRLFPDDERQFNPDLHDEAIAAVGEIIKTGKPLCGGWR